MLLMLTLTWIVCMLMIWIYVKLAKPKEDRQRLRKYRLPWYIFISMLIFIRFGFSPEVEACVKTILIVFAFILTDAVVIRKTKKENPT